MKQLFDQLSIQISTLTTRTYSTSFNLGIYSLAKELRRPIYSIYGFVRVADEIVDSFAGYDQKELFRRYREDTYRAIEEGISTNPILNSFQNVVNFYGIEKELIDAFLDSMEMDLKQQQYNEEKYNKYILGSAEVVGLMCLKVFVKNDKKLYEELRPYAQKLGAAFQKVNFLRDIKQDYHILGRSYFPNVDLEQFSIHSKMMIEDDIEADFASALEGIKKLPPSSKGGVYLAYVYYQSLFKKIKRKPPQKVFSERIRIHNGKKFGLMLSSIMQHKMNML